MLAKARWQRLSVQMTAYMFFYYRNLLVHETQLETNLPELFWLKLPATIAAQGVSLTFHVGWVSPTFTRVSRRRVAAVALHTARTDVVNTMLSVFVEGHEATPPPTLLLLYNPKRGTMPYRTYFQGNRCPNASTPMP